MVMVNCTIKNAHAVPLAVGRHQARPPRARRGGKDQRTSANNQRGFLYGGDLGLSLLLLWPCASNPAGHRTGPATSISPRFRVFIEPRSSQCHVYTRNRDDIEAVRSGYVAGRVG